MLDSVPERLARALSKGRLVVFVEAGLPGEKVGQRIKALPCGLWLTPDRSCLPGAEAVRTAAEIEDGLVREVPPGSVIEIGDPGDLGTPRRPTRFRAWVGEILRRRTVLFLAGAQETAIRQLVMSSPHSRHLVVTAGELELLLDRLAGRARGVSPQPLPPLPAVSRPWVLAALAVAALVAVISWLLLYVLYGAAQNWRWLHLLPGAVVLTAAGIAGLPLIARAMAGQDLPAAECYARALARWSRAPRAPLAALAVGLAALAPWWLAARYVPSTFLVLYEAAGVASDARGLGACKAEEPCTVIVPRNSHLHFEGAEGGCGLDLPAAGGLIIIDLQEEGCEPYREEEMAPAPRSG